MEVQSLYLTLLLMALVTAAPRLLPFYLFGKRPLSKASQQWLSYVPVAVLCALLAPELFLKEKELNLTFSNLYFWAALPTFFIGFLSRNLFLTIFVGMASVALARFFGWVP